MVKRVCLDVGPGVALSTAERQTGTPLRPEHHVMFGERVLVKRRCADPRQPRWESAWCMGFDATDILALHESGFVKHHGNWREAPGNSKVPRKKAVNAMTHTQLWVRQRNGSGAAQGLTVPVSTWPAKRLLGENKTEQMQKKPRTEKEESRAKRPATEPHSENPRKVQRKKESTRQQVKENRPRADDSRGGSRQKVEMQGAQSKKRTGGEQGCQGKRRRAENTIGGNACAAPTLSLPEKADLATCVENYMLQAEKCVKDASKILHDEPAMLKGEKKTRQEARRDEVDQLLRMKAVQPIEECKVPPGSKIISGRWVDSEKAPGICKARWVARGFEERVEGPDEVFAATAMGLTTRLILANATARGWTAAVADVSGAFLNASVGDEEEIYVKAPAEWNSGKKPKQCWEVKKALYGLRSAPRRWQDHLTAKLEGIGLTRNKLDECFLCGQDVALSYHVDDILLTGTRDAVARILRELNAAFKIKHKSVDESGVRFLGRALKWCPVTKCSSFSVGHEYVEELAYDFGLESLKPVSKLKMNSREESSPILCDGEQRRYRQMVGRMLWVDRPDVRCAVTKLATRCGNATEGEMKNMINVLRYLRGTPVEHVVAGMVLEPAEAVRAPCGSVFSFADADWGGEHSDRKSYSGYYLYVKAVDNKWYPVGWGSKRQSVVALSSAESELAAIVIATTECIGLMQLARSLLGNSSALTELIVATDSTAAISIVKRKGASRRVRHVELRAFFLQDIFRREYARIVKIGTTKNIADMLTKPLPDSRHLWTISGIKDRNRHASTKN